MYCPDPFAETRPEILRALIQRYPLATLVSVGANGLEANHIPLYLAPDEGPQPVLQGHVARANPLWREVSPDNEVLVIFQGPQHYISPSWYATKAETGKVVPTWNYAVVHAYGRLHVRDDPAWVRQQMVALTAQQENGFTLPWRVEDAPQDFTERLIQQVVGIEIPISRWVGKWKVSQNQPLCNRDSVVAHLAQQKQPDSEAMAEYVLVGLKGGKRDHP
ncbi:FMN-binding negative transcriptional regulator [Acidithiobacillus sp.]|jgi:transcriptional regulator|uniref:FMN-binding negative transcriptional regulator n=1 Tax=Acidithiobacillus sp. TaxID=1872118 RepID=UPI0025BD10FD|nr:FMN-binding negative transcriptional regulator [Acidithiobacillus sp.]MCK9189302.1 FMN-binding negative transcriptional regulator [Acidithiobacillus sp.]MCK9359378.1 FMN-binding negative transcriptional regulator [Acidithiobacillus sp.]